MTTVIITSNLENEIKDIRALEAKINELKELKEEKENIIKTVMDNAGVEEMSIGAFCVRFQNVVRKPLSLWWCCVGLPIITSVFPCTISFGLMPSSIYAN